MVNENLLSLSKDNFMRSKIVAALKRQLAEMPLDKVTVTSVCDCAGISRSSFYNLFTNINDVISWEFSRLVDETFDVHQNHDWRESFTLHIVAMCNAMLADAKVYKRLGKNMDRVEYNSAFSHTHELWIKIFTNIIKQGNSELLDKLCAFEIEFFFCATSNTIANWMTTMKENPEKLARNIVACIPEHLGSVIDSCMDTTP